MSGSAKKSLKISAIVLWVSDVEVFDAIAHEPLSDALCQIGPTKKPEVRQPQIECRGRLRGNAAKARAEFLSVLAQAAAYVSLSFCSHIGKLRISLFEADYRRSYDIPYRLRFVVQDQSDPAGNAIIEALASTSRARKALVALVCALARQSAHDTSTEPSNDIANGDKP